MLTAGDGGRCYVWIEHESLPESDQAVSVDEVFAQWKGQYFALWHVIEHQGLTPYLDQELSQVVHN
jgi:hypothetical protein